MSWREAASFAPAGPHRYRGALTEEWYQGRGVYGGLIGALLLDACAREVADPERAARSLAVQLCAPAVAGETFVEARVERAGRSVSQLSARMEQGGQPVALAIAGFARPRASRLVPVARLRPSMPPPEACPDGPEALYLPEFCRFFELRQALGPAPFEGGGDAHIGGWCRLKDDDELDAGKVVGLIDAWPPAAVCLYPEWGAVATVDFMFHFHTATFPGGWCAFEARSHAIGDGLADEQSYLWSEDGRLLASARQQIALFC